MKTGKERKIYDGNADCKDFCSRPLGIRIHQDTMYFADLLKGLMEINLKTGEFTPVLKCSEGYKSMRNVPQMSPFGGSIPWIFL